MRHAQRKASSNIAEDPTRNVTPMWCENKAVRVRRRNPVLQFPLCQTSIQVSRTSLQFEYLRTI
jgi:hypothetical protein